MNPTITDESLLRAWRANRDSDAFAELVARHGGMVYAASLRVLRDPSLSEDISQECFMELMKSRTPIRKSLPGWLHIMATRRASNHARSSLRQKTREERYTEQTSNACEAEWDDVSAYVDEAIAKLPERLRQPIILRFLEGQTYERIAEQTGVTHPTVKRRIDKGVESIRRDLMRKGVTVASTALAVLLAASPTHALPNAAAASIGKAALAGHAAVAGGVTTLKITAVTGGVIAIKQLIAALAAMVAIILGLMFVAEDSPEPVIETAASLPEPVASSLPVEQVVGETIPAADIGVSTNDDADDLSVLALENEVFVNGVVLDNLGRLVAEAQVEAAWPTGKASVSTDEDGAFRFAVPKNTLMDGPLVIVRKLNFQGEAHDAPFHGLVDGDSLSGVLGPGWQEYPVSGRRVGTGTGALGVWDTVVEDNHQKYEGRLIIEGEFGGPISATWIDELGPPEVTQLVVPDFFRLNASFEDLRAFRESYALPPVGLNDLVVTMVKGASVEGKVLLSNGEPVPGWHIYARSEEHFGSASVSDSGAFRISGLRAGTYELVAKRSNDEIEYPGGLVLRVGEHATGVMFIRDVGWGIAGLVTNQDGVPLEGIKLTVRCSDPDGSSSVLRADMRAEATTDETGSYFIQGLPTVEGYTANFYIGRADYIAENRRVAMPILDDVDFVLYEKPRLSGRVLDAATGEAISNYRMYTWMGQDASNELGVLRFTVGRTMNEHMDGEFSIQVDGYNFVNIGISSPGYEVGKTRIERVAPGETREDIRILLEPVAPLRGIVVNDSGEPVPNASIFLGYPVAPDGGGIPGRVAARTDANGKFTLEEYPGALSIVSASHLGYAPSFVGIGVEAARTSPIRLTLNRGGRMEGVVSYGGIPLRADQLCFVTLYIGGEMYEGSTRTGDGGAYTHETLPVGENLISVGFHEHGRRYIQRLVTIRENETVYENFDLADTYDSAMEGVVLVDGVPSETHLRAIVPFANGDVIHYQTMTSSDGNYRLSEFPAATFEFGPLAVRMPDGSFLHTEQATLTTQPGQTLRHDIHIERQ